MAASRFAQTPYPTTSPRVRSDVTQRAPGALDDALAGYAVGDIWAYNGRAWVCSQSNVGNASWDFVPAGSAPPTQAVGGTGPIFIGGTRRFDSTYTGNLINVVRTDTTALDIGQDTNWGLDAKAAEAFGANSILNVATIYNQNGTANHITQATAANRPILQNLSRSGNVYSVVFDSRRQGTLVNKSMAISGTINSTTVATSVFMVVRNANAISQSELLSLTGTSAARNIFMGYSAGANTWRTGVTGTGLTPLPGKPSLHSEIVGFISSGSAHTMYVENTSLAAANIGSTAWNGGFLGYSADDTANTGYFETPAIVIYGRALSATERLNLMCSLYVQLGISPQVRNTLTFYGDSITESYGGSGLQSYGRKVIEQMPFKDYEAYTVGAFGQTAAALAVQSTMTSYLGTIPNTGARNNALVIWCGTNDYNGSATGASVFASIKQIAQQARVMGYGPILVGTTLPRGSLTAAQDTERQNGNGFLRFGWSTFADGLLDFASDATMGVSTAPSDGTLYLDTIHPVDRGYTFVSQLVAPVLSNLWN